MKWILRTVIALVAFIATTALGGCAYQAIAQWNDARTFPAPGQLFDVGGYRLHLLCAGEGTPTAILDAAFTAQVSNWVWVQRDVSRTTRVCAYDRAGHGWSDAGAEPRDARQHAHELKTLLDRASVSGPYVLVGHSLGALYVREFAEMFPGEAAGMVLIEGTHPEGWKRQGIPEGIGADAAMLDVAPILARAAFFRLGLFPLPKADPALPERQRKEEQAYFNSVKYFETLRAVNKSFAVALQQVRQTKPIDPKPLAVVVGTASDNYRGVARELQQDLLNLSTNHSFVAVRGATHSGLVDDERYAAETAEVVRQVVEEVRGRN